MRVNLQRHQKNIGGAAIQLFHCTDHQYVYYLSADTICERQACRLNMNRLMMTDMNEDLNRNYTAIKNEFLKKGIAESVTTASSGATNSGWHRDVDDWPGKKPGKQLIWEGSMFRKIILKHLV